MVKHLAYNVGDLGLIPGSGRSSGEGNGNPLQYSCLEIPWVEEHGGLHTVHWVAKSQTRLRDFTSLPREKYVSVVSAARNPLLPPLLTTF